MQLSMLFVLFSQLLGAGAVLTDTGSTVRLNGVNYYIPPYSVGSVAVPRSVDSSSQFVPLTAFTTDATSFAISSAAQNFAANDDVFQTGFLDISLVQYTGSRSSNVTVTNAPERTIVIQSFFTNATKIIPQGPYFLSASSGTIHKAYRLYSDFAGAFTETVTTDQTGVFYVLPANVPGQSLSVAVPSRLYFNRTATKPLDGVRLGVKDLFDIKGLKTSNGNRAWYHFYPPANATATAVQRLIDAGAVVVGKMKTGQFALGGQATAWIDYSEPFNPRGDGYQDTSGSSSGPGAGEATYPWFDISLGSDTGGSVRGPAEVQGIFGNRPSHGLVPLTHVMPLAPSLDTAGLLCRDPALWAAAAEVLYVGLKKYPEFPTEIITINDYPTCAGESATLFINFAHNLSKFLGGASIKPYDVRSAFAADPPAAAKTGNINKLIDLIYPTLTSKEQVRLVRNRFFADYAAKYDGRTPFVDPPALANWKYGMSRPESEVSDALRNQSIFATWIATNMLPHSNTSCSSRVLIYAGSTALADPRTGCSGPPTPVSGGIRISEYGGCPDYTLPIGQATYHSGITDHQEVLPVTIQMMVARNCDGMLFDMVAGMVKEGMLNFSQPGRTVEDGGQVLF